MHWKSLTHIHVGPALVWITAHARCGMFQHPYATSNQTTSLLQHVLRTFIYFFGTHFPFCVCCWNNGKSRSWLFRFSPGGPVSSTNSAQYIGKLFPVQWLCLIVGEFINCVRLDTNSIVLETWSNACLGGAPKMSFCLPWCCDHVS